MSEQLPIDNLQFAAQIVPQALKTTLDGNSAAAADFKKFLLEQRLNSGEGLQSDGPPVTGEPAAAGLLSLLATPTPGGNSLPPGGSVLQPSSAARTALSFSQLARVAGIAQTEVSADDAAVLAAANNGSQERLVEQALSVASRSLSASLTSTSQAVSASDKPADLAPVESLPEADNLLQALLGNQRSTVRGSEGQADTVRPQFVQQLSTNIAQPQASAVTYTTVAVPQTTPVAPESGLLSSQPLQTVNIDVPVQSNEWSRAFAERAVWLVNNQQSAQLRLTPASLGQIDIQVSVKDDEASITFNTQNNVVRETVEASLPRLRDMLESQGLNLIDVNVNDGQSPNQDGFASVFDNPDRRDSEETESVPLPAAPPMLVSSVALDLYV